MQIHECKIGMKIGSLTVKDKYRNDITLQMCAVLECDCGNFVYEQIGSIPINDRLTCNKNCPFTYKEPKSPKIIKEPSPPRIREFVKVGDKFGKLLIKEIWTDKKTSKHGKEYTRTMVKCDCDCGIKDYIRQAGGLHKNAGCGCNVGKMNISYSKYFSSVYFNQCRQKAEKRNIKFNLTIEDMDQMYERQNGLCFYTGEKLILPPILGGQHNRHLYNLSIDRINSLIKEYNLDNCVLCTKTINLFKNKYSITDLYDMCDKICSSENVKNYRESHLNSNIVLSKVRT